MTKLNTKMSFAHPDKYHFNIVLLRNQSKSSNQYLFYLKIVLISSFLEVAMIMELFLRL
jgi:hypothetical protein